MLLICLETHFHAAHAPKANCPICSSPTGGGGKLLAHIIHKHRKSLCEHCGEIANEKEDHNCDPSKLLKDIPKVMVSNKRIVTFVRNGESVSYH